MLKGSAFPCIPGMNKISSGVFSNVKGVRCYEDGHLTVKYKVFSGAAKKIIGGADTDLEFSAGEDMDLGNNVFSAEVTSGKFSLSNLTTV